VMVRILLAALVQLVLPTLKGFGWVIIEKLSIS